MLATRHRPDAGLAAGRSTTATGRGAPTPTHPVVAGAARALLDMDPRTASGVIATAQAQLDLFRDPILAANTAKPATSPRWTWWRASARCRSTSPCRPASWSACARRCALVLNQLCRALTTTPPRVPSTAGAPAGAAGHAAGNAAKHAAGHGTDRAAGEVAPAGGRCCCCSTSSPPWAAWTSLAAPWPTCGATTSASTCRSRRLVQLLDIYGPYQSITANCGLQVAFTPADLETAELLSRMTGLRTINLFRRSLHTGASALAPQPAPAWRAASWAAALALARRGCAGSPPTRRWSSPPATRPSAPCACPTSWTRSWRPAPACRRPPQATA